MADANDSDEPKGIIAKTVIDGNDVILKLVNEMPNQGVQQALPKLVVITWEYNGESNQGMPSDEELELMKQLETTIRKKMENDQTLRHVYSKTGNHIKELVYYCNDPDEFLASFNLALLEHPEYPLDISFYDDEEWEDFKNLLANFQ